MIRSTSNAQVKETAALQSQAKARAASGLFVAEGLRLVREAPAEDVVRVYMTEDVLSSEEGAALALRLPLETVSSEVFARMSDTRTPQGVLAVVRQKSYTLEDFSGGALLVLERVQDPGNVGTLFRTAEAAGFGGIVMEEGCADPYQPKAVRSTMGAVFRLPFIKAASLRDTLRGLAEDGVMLAAAHPAGDVLYDQVSYPRRSAFLLGNEGNGLSEEISALAQVKVRIPMAGRTESLNVASAGAVLMYEYFRQRRQRVQWGDISI